MDYRKLFEQINFLTSQMQERDSQVIEMQRQYKELHDKYTASTYGINALKQTLLKTMEMERIERNEKEKYKNQNDELRNIMDSFQMSDLGSSKLNIEFNKLKEDFKNIIEEKTMLEKEIVKCRERISYQNNGENKLIQDNEKLKQQLNDKNRVVIQLQEEITSNVNVNRMLTFENENLKQQLEKNLR